MKTLEKTIVGATAPTNTNVLWIDSKNNQIKYNNNNRWVRTSNHSDDTLDVFLPRTGGTMNGSINMKGNRIDNIGIEEVSSLPTANLYEGRMVKFKNKTYTFYNGLWLALSDDLRGRVNDTHEENFVYQPTAADLSIKDGFADIKKLKGNTLVWNQIFTIPSSTLNGVTLTNNNDGSYILNGASSKDADFFVGVGALLLNHKYLFKLYNFKEGIVYFWASGGIGKKYSSFVYNNTSFQGSMDIIVPSGVTLSNYKVGVSVVDLTQMFGEGNEPATVEEFEAMFPNSYYEYNEGELMSFDGKGLKSIGFNQWDEEWEVGAYNISDGSVISGPGGALHIRNTNPIKALPDTDYHFKSPVTLFVFWYDSDMNFISCNQAKDTTSTSPANAAYLNFYQYGNNTYGNDICINISHSGYRNEEYEPYEDYTLVFNEGKTISQLTGKLNGEGDSVTIFPDGLRSAGEAFDEIVYDESTGKHKAIKRIGSVDMGTLSFRHLTNNNALIFILEKAPNLKSSSTNIVANILTTKYSTKNYEDIWNMLVDKSCGLTSKIIAIVDSSYTDATSFKSSLSGQILYYELETPEVYELDFPINTSYEAYDFGTEEVLYNNDKEVNIPMKASIEYGFNAVDMIRNNFEEIRTLKDRVTALEQAIQQMQNNNTEELLLQE